MGTSVLWEPDTQLHDAVQRQLDWEPDISTHGIAVTAQEGIVTLTGFVHTYAEKVAAEKAVKSVRGVRGVANDIEVKPIDERSDPEIAKDALHALQSHTAIPATITVTVRNGFLTLEGTVEWMHQKSAAESAVKFLKGVKAVANLIRINPTVSPTEVKTKIEEALRRSAEVDAGRISVVAKGAVVTLSGQVRSWVEKQEAERAAWGAPGVTRVENHIIVTP
jgi:osmotically-inducible protein OsmY